MSGLRTLTRLITATAVVVTYVALILAITAGIDLRERNAFHDAPAQVAAFLKAADQGSVAEARAVAEWFSDRAPSRGGSRYSISNGADAVEYGDVSRARRSANSVGAEIEQDQKTLDAKFAASRAVAVPWLVIASVLVVLALVLRHRRRSANVEAVELASRFVPPQPPWRRPVFLVVSGIGYTLLVAAFPAIVMATRVGAPISSTVRGLSLLGGVVALVVASFVLRYSRPRSARSAVQALRADWRTPVLYLRGFDDDRESAWVDELPVTRITGLANIHSREEQFVCALGAFGPVIAVGRPGEPLPHLGAARFYLPFDDWQPGVLRLMELSQLIVLRLGEGDGLWWEFDQARATQPANKLVVLVPGERDGLAERLDERLPTPTRLAEVVTGHDDQWASAVIVFDHDWTSRVSPVGPFPGAKNRGATPMFHLAHAMQTALESVGSRRRAMGWRANSGTYATMGKVLLLIPVLVLLALTLKLIILW